MPWECVCSVSAWWQPELLREQVRLCDGSDRSMMERSLKKLSVCSSSHLSIVTGCVLLTLLLLDYENKGIFLSLQQKLSANIKLAEQNPFSAMKTLCPCGLKGAFPGCHKFPSGLLCAVPAHGTEEGNSTSSTAWRGFLHLLPTFHFLGTFMLLYTQGCTAFFRPWNFKFLSAGCAPHQITELISFFLCHSLKTFLRTNHDMMAGIDCTEEIVQGNMNTKDTLPSIIPRGQTPSLSALLCSAQDQHPQDQQHKEAIPGTPKAPKVALREPRPAHGALLVLTSCIVEILCWFPCRKKCPMGATIWHFCWPPSLDICSLLGTHQAQTKMLSFYTLKRI